MDSAQLASALMKLSLLPAQASTSASQVDQLYLFLVGLSAFFVVLIFVPMAYCLFRYRRGRRANRSPLQLPTTRIEIIWTLLPLLLAIGIFAWGARVYLHLRVPPADALELNIVAKQWMWKVQHPQGQREINELHVPRGRAVRLTLASEDVIHSFYVPAFRLKQDVVPGRLVTTWFSPTRAGVYHLFCAEFCGTDHSKMIGTVHVLEPAQYEQWLARGGAGDTMAQAGGKLFRSLGCGGCHAGASTGPVQAPPLEGLYGRWVTLKNGKTVLANDEYLREAILLPGSQVTAGYSPLMPAFAGLVGEEEMFQLLAYIKSLGTSPRTP